jgi:5-methylcytosine-specific restriction endonuclease McrA
MSDFKFELGRHQISKISREKVIADLEKVAKHFNYKDFRQDDFDKIADISYYKVYREFGSWEKALEFLKEYLKRKGIEFEITRRRSKYSTQEMFDELERLWVQLGHRPSRNEWTALKPKISYDAIQRRFGGWQSACLKFVEYKSGGAITAEVTKTIAAQNVNQKLEKDNPVNSIEKTRAVPLNIRFKVLNRDNFRCVYCGKSPATDLSVKLHIDHIVPFSRGGTNSLENLQTLCEQCNYGKSNTELNKCFSGEIIEH